MESQVIRPIEHEVIPEPYNSSIERAQNRLTLMESDLRRLCQFKVETEEECASLDRLVQERKESLAVLDSTIAEKQLSISHLDSEIAEKNANKNKISKENEMLLEEQSSLKENVAKVSIENKSLEVEKARLFSDLSAGKDELKQIKDRSIKAMELLKQAASL